MQLRDKSLVQEIPYGLFAAIYRPPWRKMLWDIAFPCHLSPTQPSIPFTRCSHASMLNAFSSTRWCVFFSLWCLNVAGCSSDLWYANNRTTWRRHHPETSDKQMFTSQSGICPNLNLIFMAWCLLVGALPQAKQHIQVSHVQQRTMLAVCLWWIAYLLHIIVITGLVFNVLTFLNR